jgi:hypothetical protein
MNLNRQKSVWHEEEGFFSPPIPLQLQGSYILYV